MINMASYICVKCRKEFEAEDRIRCTFCGYRIVAKPRTPFRKRVQAK